MVTNQIRGLLFSILILATIFSSMLLAQNSGGDFLNEAPLSPIPDEMTFEEYQDMNRRLTVGLALAAVPLPGMIHFYAGEKKTGWLLLGSAAVGVGSIIAGASMADKGDFPDSDFNLLVLNSGDEERERRFEQVPVKIEGADTTFRLKEIYREPDGAGAVLIAAGAAILLFDIAYDFIHGIRTIEQKRNRVRFKYGKKMQFGMRPEFDYRKQSVGLGLAVRF